MFANFDPYLRAPLRLAVAISAYVVAGHVGLAMARFPLGASSVWPASGVAVALLYLWGWRYWPVIFLGGAWINGLTGTSWAVMAMSGLGNAAGAVAGSWVLRRLLVSEGGLEHQTETAAFLASGLVAGFCSAIGGAFGRALFESRQVPLVLDSFLTWSFGDALGVWLVAPALLILAEHRFFSSRQEFRRFIAAVLFAVAIGLALFHAPLPIECLFLLFPLLGIVVRFWGAPATKVVAVCLAVIAFGGTLNGGGPLVGRTLAETHLHLQVFLGLIALTSLTLCGFRVAGCLRVAGIALCIGWLVATGVFHSFRSSVLQEEQQRFAVLADQGREALAGRLDVLSDTLHGIAGLFAANPRLDAERWHAYVESLGLWSRYRGLAAIGVVRVRQGRFLVEYANGPRGVRNDLLGMDVTERLSPSSAIALAGQSGLAALTVPLSSPGAPKLALLAPIYLPVQKSLYGYAFVSFFVADSVREALGPLLGQLRLDLYDGESLAAAHPLFASEGPASPYDVVRTIALRGHPLTLAWRRGPEFASQGALLAMWMGALGVVLSLLVAVLVVNLQETTRRARGIAREQTARLQASEELLATLLDHLPLAIYCKSRRAPHPIVFWNRFCEDMFGVRRRDVVGRAARDFLPSPIADRSDESDRFAIEARGRLIEIPEFAFECPTRGRIFLHTRKCVVDGFGDQEGYILGITEDVTARKRNKQQLIEAREAALAATRAKSEFLANMSHELRTPLNAVIGLSGLLQHSDLPAESRELARVIRQSGDALLTVINDILDYSKLEAGELQLEHAPWEIDEWVLGTCEILAMDARAKGLQFEVRLDPGLPPIVEGDPKRVRQILLNLLNNAMKFTHRGRIEVNVSGQASGPGATLLRVEVMDTGIGIPESARGRLFQAFSQVNSSSTRQYAGTGLGLSICRRLVERMGGEIGFRSQEGVGSTFWFSLPVSHSERSSVVASGTAASTADRPWSILVAEDNPANEMVIRAVLEQLGCQVTVVPDGVEALRAVERARFELVLLDCQMPEMDGFETARRIRAQEVGSAQRIPIIALTAFAEDRAAEIRESGMDGWLRKPIDVDELADLLRAYLGGSPPGPPPLEQTI